MTGTTVPTTNVHHISLKEDGIDGDEAVTAAVAGLLDKVGILKLGKDGMYFGRILNNWPTHTGGISPILSEREQPLIQNVTIDIDRSLLHRYRRRHYHEKRSQHKVDAIERCFHRRVSLLLVGQRIPESFAVLIGILYIYTAGTDPHASGNGSSEFGIAGESRYQHPAATPTFIMHLGFRLTWDDIDMRMEYVGARATCQLTIDMPSNDMARQALMTKNIFVNAHVCAQCSVVSSSATLTLLPLAVAKTFQETTLYKTTKCS